MTAEQAQAEAEADAAREIERKRQAAEDRKRRAAQKKERQAKILAEPIISYGNGFDNRNSVSCSRCGGTGHMPFSVWQGRCFKCGGACRLFTRVLTQPKDKVTADLSTCAVGEIIEHGGTKYRVHGIEWRLQQTFAMDGLSNNQRVRMTRLVDGDTALALLRQVYYKPSEEE